MRVCGQDVVAAGHRTGEGQSRRAQSRGRGTRLGERGPHDRLSQGVPGTRRRVGGQVGGRRSERRQETSCGRGRWGGLDEPAGTSVPGATQDTAGPRGTLRMLTSHGFGPWEPGIGVGVVDWGLVSL